MDDGLTDGAVDNLPFNDCDELFDVNCGLADDGVVADFWPTDFWPLGVRSRCGGCCCRMWLPSAGLLRAWILCEKIYRNRVERVEERKRDEEK